MGILTDIFSSLFGVLWDIGEWIFQAFVNVIQFVIDLIVGFFNIIIDLISGILYLLYMIGVLAVKLFLVLFEALKVLWSLVVGFGNTLASLQYTQRTSSGTGYSETIGKVFNTLEYLNLAPLAYILLFSLWIITAITAMRMISSIRAGGD